MITIPIDDQEDFDTTKGEFVTIKGGMIDFEYSLLAIAKWESKWKKPFLKGGLNGIETYDFYVTMAVNPIDPRLVTDDVMEILSNYIKDDKTATTFSQGQNDGKTRTVQQSSTAEEIYAMMFNAGIPIEFESRNFNHLVTILRVIAAKNNPPKKMSKEDIYKQNAELNALRRKQLNSKG